ncbi:hypothetical protein BMS3Bbin04_00164 [bacterium BMS3Bbin04]|nr:hypothetical protein BMS3Bbin04_00164 [bacterium BMS3Bbin04]
MKKIWWIIAAIAMIGIAYKCRKFCPISCSKFMNQI